MHESITYYGMDESLRTTEHGPVSVDQAKSIVEERFAKFKPFYESGGEALTDTMFGFSRSEETFIEICIHGPTQTAFRLEMPSRKKGFFSPRVYLKEIELQSKEAVIEYVEAFFFMDIQTYQEYLEHREKR